MDDSELITERLVLRRFRPTDGPALYGYLSLPEVVRYEPYPAQTLTECEHLAAERAGRDDMWAVCLANGTLIGNLYLHRCEPESWHTWELGYVFHPDHWGNGYATEAAAALLDRCFSDAAAHRVKAACDPRNAPSWALLERLGFRREGHLLQDVSSAADAAGEPIWNDSYLYAVLATEWTQR